MRLLIFLFFSVLISCLVYSQPETSVDYEEKINTLFDNIDSLNAVGEYEKSLSFAREAVELSIAQWGVESEAYINCLYYEGLTLNKLEKYNESVGIFEQALEIVERKFDGQHESYTSILNSLAITYIYSVKYDKAEKIIQKSLDYTAKTVGRESPDYSYQLGTLANVFYVKGNYALSADTLQTSIDIFERTIGKDNPGYAKKISNLGVLYEISGQYEKALSCYQQAVSLTESLQGKNHPDYGVRLNRLGGAYCNLGNYDEGLRLLRESKHLIGLNIGTQHPRYIEILNSLGASYMELERYEAALNYMMEALDLSQIVMGEQHPFTQQLFEFIGQLEMELGNYSEALEYLEKGLKVTKETLGEEHRDNFRKLMSIGKLYNRLGQTERAFSMLHEAKRLIEKLNGKEHFDYCEIIQPLAEVYEKKGDLNTSTSLKKEALEIVEKLGGKKHPLYSFYLNDLATTYLNNGSYTKAINLTEQAIKVAQSNFGEDHYYYHYGISNKAKAYYFLNQNEKAIAAYLETLVFYKNKFGFQHQNTGVILRNLGDVYWKEEQLDSAAHYYSLTLKNYQAQLENYYPFLSESERLIYIRSIEDALDEISSFSLSYPGFALDLQNMLLEMKGKALDYSIQSKRDVLAVAESDSELAETYYEWKAVERKIEKYTLSSGVDLGSNNVSINLDSLSDVANRLEGKISEAMNIRLAAEHTFINEDIRNRLNEEEAAVNFFHFNFSRPYEKKDSIIYCAIITQKSQKTPTLVQLCQERDLENLLNTSIIRNTNNYLTNPQISKQLYELIWMPLVPYLKNVQHIHLSPSGLLHQVAFDVLKPNLNSKDLLFDEYQLTYHSNFRDFIQSKKVSSTNNIALVGGAIFDLDSTALHALLPEFIQDKTPQMDTLQFEMSIDNTILAMRSIANDSTRAGVVFNYLPDSKKEVENIHAQFNKKGKESQLLVGKTALEDRIKSMSGATSPHILHIATHGYFFKPYNNENSISNTLRERILSSENPLVRSGLVFTGVNHTWLGGTPIEGLDDGVLTAYEISNLDLFNTKLAVLSACETGRGDVHDAEGVFGLQRAFKTAGVDQLIISLWKVPDQATAEMMSLFYKYYLKGKSVNEAFRQARKKMRKKYEPYYWAAFVLVE